jgi:hypothetical protein
VSTARVSSADRCARIGYPTLRLPARIAQIRIAGDDAARSTHADHGGAASADRGLLRGSIGRRAGKIV